MMRRPLRIAACCALLAPILACERAALVESTEALLPAGVDVVYTVAGGPAEAFRKSNRLLLLFRDSTSTRLESQVSFDGGAGTTRVPVLVRLRRPAETMTFQLEVRRDGDAVFRGATRVALRAGRTTTTSVVLEPVIAGVRMTDSIPLLTAWGDSVRLSAAAVFVTGDTLPDVPLLWASLDTAVARVNAEGVVVARTDGAARITARNGTLSDTGTVRILAAGVSMQVSPAGAAIPIGSARQYAVTIVDRRGNRLTRSVSWNASDTTVLKIDANGLARSVGLGPVTVRAVAGALAGEVPASGVPAAPAVQNVTAVVTGPGAARLDARILPNGAVTEGWFEWAPATASPPPPALTLRQSLGAGIAAIPLTAALQGLLPNTRYVARAVAVNGVGSAVSDSVSFTTPGLVPSVVTVGHSLLSTGQIALSATVNPNNAQTQVWFQWSTSPSLAGADSSARQTVSGLATLQHTTTVPAPVPGSTLYFRIIARNATGTSAGAILSTAGSPPASLVAITAMANGVSKTEARLHGIVFNGNAPASAAFEWGTDPSLTASSTTLLQTLPPAMGGLPITAVVQNLNPNTPYFYRTFARNTGGTTQGTILSFTTQADSTVAPPIVTTLSAGVLDVAVQLNGSADPRGAATSVWFEWSTDPGFASFTTTTHQSAGSAGTVSFQQQVVGIPSGIDHYYRAVASNAGGTVYGAVVSFRR